ncbi:MAG: TIGR04290 family methyltransferase [Chitinophagaceae bacterium]|nr:TIGR04290 family methyltransferase [Chitinophagaceae bacterium]
MEKIASATGNGRLKEKIETLKPWFHNLHLPNGVRTAPDHSFGDFPKFKWDQIKNKIPRNLEGWTALDIGCNAGFYSFELAKRGADVLGIDLDPHYLKQANWAAKILQLNHKVTFKQMQVYDLAKTRRIFDIVIFMGVFYHLRYPMLALDVVTQKVRNILIFQTLTMPGKHVMNTEEDMKLTQRKKMLKKGWPLMAFIEKRLANDPTNWWAPNHSCILAMLRTCGLNTVANPAHEIYIAKPDMKFKSVAKTWNSSEYLSAIGQEWMNKLEQKVKTKF